METFIERINKLAVDTGDGSPKIIGSNLVIYEFNDFIRKLKEEMEIVIEDIEEIKQMEIIIDKLAGNVSKDTEVAEGEKE